MPRLEKQPKIETLADLEDYIYEAYGVLDMEDVRCILDVIKRNQHLLQEHVEHK